MAPHRFKSDELKNSPPTCSYRDAPQGLTLIQLGAQHSRQKATPLLDGVQREATTRFGKESTGQNKE
jgi:hypothetical protein